jgi:tight adherence protein C
MDTIIQLFSEDYIILLLSLGATFVAAFLFALNILPDPEAIAAIRRLGVDDQLPKESKVLMIKVFRPLFSLLLTRVSKIKYFNRIKIGRKLLTANLLSEITSEEMVAFKFFCAVLFPILGVFLLTTLGMAVPVFILILLVVAGFYYPDIWVSSRIKERRREILSHLSYTIDVLTLSVEAGLDFISAITRLVQKTKPNALTEELTQMLKEIRLGTSRSDALRNLADRLQIEEIASLATVLIQVDKFGASIGPVLRAQSDQIRSNRFYSAEKAGARASQLILLPMVLCIFPTIFLVVLGPFYVIYSTKGFF